MKLGPVTKLDKRNKTTRKIDDGFILTNCYAIVIFQIFGQFETIWKSDCRCIFYRSCILLITTFYLTQTENRTKKSYTTFPWLLRVKVLFLPKNTDISKIKSALALTRYIFVNLRTVFQVSSMAVITAPSNSKRTPKKPTQIGVKMHNENICRIAIY